MRRLMLVGALALATTAQAQVVVRAPGVYVEVGPAVVVRAFGIQVVVPRRSAVPAMPAVPPAVAPVFPPAAPPADVLPPARPLDPGVPPVPKEEELLLPPPIPVPGARPKTVPPAAAARAVTPEQFVSGAKPFKPGAYEVVFLHPSTNRPVKVNFELPVPPRRVNATPTRIDFRWGLFKGVSLHFEPDGTVRVKG